MALSLKRLLKILGRIVIVVFVLILLLGLAIQTTPVQNFIVDKITSSLEKQLGSKVQIGSVRLKFFSSAQINQIYLEDQQQDTLLYVDQLSASIGLFSLFNKKIAFDQISISGVHANLSRSFSDSLYNFQFIIDNFTQPVDSTVVQQTTSTSWDIDFDLVSIDQLHFNLNDSLGNTFVFTQVEELSIDADQFDPAAQILDLNSLILKNPDIQIKIAANPADTISSTSSTLQFPYTGWSMSTNKASIEDGIVTYKIIGRPEVNNEFDPQNLGLGSLDLELSNFAWDSSRLQVNLDQLSTIEKSGLNIQESKASLTMTESSINIKDFSLETTSSKLKNTTHLTFNSWHDLNDLLNLVKLESQFGPSKISVADFERFQNFIPEDYRIDQALSLEGDIVLNKQNISLNNLNLSAGNLLNIQLSGFINPFSLKHDINLKNLRANYKKLRLELPVLQLPDLVDSFGIITLNGRFKGDNLSSKIQGLNLKTSSTTALSANGVLRSFLNPNALNYDFQIKQLITSANDLAFFTNSELPPGLYEMNNIEYSGLLAGGINSYTTKGKLSTDIGTLNTDLLLDFNKTFSHAEYSGNFSLENFDIGRFTRDTLQFGEASLGVTIKGEGIEADSLNIVLDATIDQIVFNGYNYKNIAIDGAIDRMEFLGKAGMNDPNLAFDFDGKVNLNESIPVFQFQLQLDTIDLAALNLSTDSIKASATFESNFKGQNADDFLGTANIRQLNLSNYSKDFHLDSLVMVSQIKDDKNKVLTINSDLIKASFDGQYNLTDLPNIFINYINDFFPVDQFLSPADQPEDLALEPFSQTELPDQNLKFTIFFDDLPRLTKLFTPALESMDTLYLKGSFNTQDKSLSSNLVIPSMDVSGWEVDSLTWNMNGDVRELDSRFYISQLTQGTMNFRKNTILAKINDNKLKADFKIFDDNLNPIFEWGALLQSPDKNYLLSFNDTLRINDESWLVDNQHQVQMAPDFLFIRDLNFEKNNQSLSINTFDKANGVDYTPIELGFKNVSLSEFSDFTNIEDFDFAGLLNGKITLNDLTKNPHYTADLSLNKIVINDTLIGDINILAQQKSSSPEIDLQVRLSGNGNDLQLNGNYNISSRMVQADLDIQRAPFILADPFSSGAIRNSSGFLSGQFSILGNVDAPSVNGQLTFKNAATTISYLNSRYFIPNHTIQVTDKGIDFGQMTLKDSYQNKAKLSGNINYNNFEKINLDLKFDTKQFQFLNTEAGDNDLFYGTLNLSALVDITGPLKEPKININAGTLPGSKLFVNSILQEQVSGQADYIIYGIPGEASLDSLLLQRATAQNIAQNFDLSLNLEVNPDVELIVIVDPVSGDQLSCRGNANLTVNMPPSGAVDVRGIYTAESGNYHFSYQNLVRRAFKLDQGSRLYFVGDPMDTRFDITASYEARTSVYPLISNESNLSDANSAQAKQRTTVRVLMKMTGDLSQPVLSFDIQVPEISDVNISSIVENKISQLKSDESELNKQVFGLLLLNSFVAEQSATASISTAGENIALSSVSNLISNQLNRLSDRYLDGLGLTFDLESYRSQFDDVSSTRTNLNVGLSRSLLNERLTIKVGGVVQVDNNSSSTGEDSGYSNIAGDFVLEYQLDKSGNYILRVFQKSDYDAFNDSNTYKTGVGINFKKSFGQ